MSRADDIWEDSEELLSDGSEIWLKCKERQSRGLVHIDYLSWTVRAQGVIDDMVVSGLAWRLATRLAEILGGEIGEGRGVHFYEHGLRIQSADTLLGAVWYGGDHQRGTIHCQIPGAGWLATDGSLNRQIYTLLQEFAVPYLSRIDLARDCFEGETDYHAMQAAYTSGAFKPSRGVSPSLWKIEDERRGSTCHVGRRENGKMIRGYEKSMQLARRKGWFRVELELRSVNRRVPLEAIIDPSAFFAGANAYCAQLADSSRTERVVTQRKTVELSLSHLTDYARIGYGKLFKLLSDAGVDADQIVERMTIGVEGLPRRLRVCSYKEILRVAGIAPPAEVALSGAVTV